jgi:gamma-glutamyltranspeptidase/glutathione hydrolase
MLGPRMFLRRTTWFSAFAAAAVLLAGLPSPAAFPPPAEGSHGAVATDDAEATRAAITVMSQGGNAFDGAIAAALALGVASPAASGIGGGGFALVWSARDRRLVAIDFREVAPKDLSVEAMVARKSRGVAVGVPGEPAGLQWLSTHGAKRSLAADAAPAITLAQNGFPIGHHFASMLALGRGFWEGTALARELAPGGNPLVFGQRWQRPELARTLARFGAEGKTPFYQGDIAAKIRTAASADGSAMSDRDLADYQVRERTPLSRTVGKRTIATMPAPSAGGLMLLEHLVMWGADSMSALNALGFGSSAYDHMLAETMRGAIADRVRLSGDPDLETRVGSDYEHALDEGQLASRRARIASDKTHPGVEFKTREEGTSHMVIVDPEGNVVSLTTTINSPFGARIVAGDTGIWLNDQLNDFATPDDVAGYGTVGLGPNVPHGGARPVSSMTPTIVFENGSPILALGGSGGRRIATAVTQAALARLVFGMDPQACVSAPRIYTNGTVLYLDPEVPEDVRVGLRNAGETLLNEPMLTSAVQMVTIDRGNAGTRLLSAADPRKAGFAAAW